MGRSWGNGYQVTEVGHAPGRFQLIGAGELPRQCHLVDGLIALEQRAAGGMSEVGSCPVEVLRFDQWGDTDETVPIDQQRTNHRFLRLQVVGKEFLRVHQSILYFLFFDFRRYMNRGLDLVGEP